MHEPAGLCDRLLSAVVVIYKVDSCKVIRWKYILHDLFIKKKKEGKSDLNWFTEFSY